MSPYATGTQVTAARSREEIERILRRFHATGFAYGWSENIATVGFQIAGLTIRVSVPMPDPDDREFRLTPTRGTRRSDKQAAAAYEAEVNRRWRALAAVIKAKLIAVEDRVSTLEKEFLAFIVLPDGSTIGDFAEPYLARGESLPLLPQPPPKSLGRG